MAWITKPSATTKIERRDEPYLTDAMQREIRETYMPRYETRLACTLPALHLVQHEYGWIPAQALEEIAAILELEPADVLDTASFYEEYWLNRKGRHVVAVCRSIACEFCGQRDVTDAVKTKLEYRSRRDHRRRSRHARGVGVPGRLRRGPGHPD